MIQPALTPEEWHYLQHGIWPWEPPQLYATPPEWARFDVASSKAQEGKMHAAATAALHGQPFGFTWADVDALLYAASGYESGDWGPLAERAAPARDLAARIAALLPPRTPGAL